MYKVTGTTGGIVHRLAFCDQCGWTDAWGEPGRSVEAINKSARRHAEKTGHCTRTETGYFTKFNPIEIAGEQPK